jgi:lysophospholipase L1-like esterase
MSLSNDPVLVTLVHMGDSITFGQYLDPKLRWTSLIADKFDAMFRAESVHVRSLNCGISGETTRMGLERFPKDVQSHRPDVLTLQFGLNDCNCWLTDGGAPRVSPNAYRANLVEMIDRARRFGARHIILANNHRTLRRKPMISGEPLEDANARYSEILRSVATECKTTFCDVRAAFEPLSDVELDDSLLPYPDLLHLSAKGNALYCSAIYPLVHEAVLETIAFKRSSIDEEKSRTAA